MEQRVSLISLGVDDLAKSKAFYEQLGWRGQEVEETVFFQTGGLAVVLWSRDKLADDDEIQLTIDFVTLSLSPTEFIQLAASLRLSVDGILEHHPAMQRAVVGAFDIKS